MREKHTPYYVVLETLQAADGCALCRMELECLARYFDSLLYEKVNDTGIRRALRMAKGYCPRHAQALRRGKSALGAAILCRDQIALALEFLDEAGSDGRRPRGGWMARRRRGAAPCPACKTQEEARLRHAEVLAEWALDSDMRQALEAAPPFCLPHFLHLLDQAGATEARTELLRMQRAKCEALAAQLDEFIRKHDHRRGGEGFGVEGDSWLRAIETLAGNDGVF